MNAFVYIVVILSVIAALLRVFNRPKACKHNAGFGGRIYGEWGQAEPHPHSRAAEAGVKVERRPFVNVAVCRDCGHVLGSTFGNDFRDPQPPATD